MLINKTVRDEFIKIREINKTFRKNYKLDGLFKKSIPIEIKEDTKEIQNLIFLLNQAGFKYTLFVFNFSNKSDWIFGNHDVYCFNNFLNNNNFKFYSKIHYSKLANNNNFCISFTVWFNND